MLLYLFVYLYIIYRMKSKELRKRSNNKMNYIRIRRKGGINWEVLYIC